MARSDIHQDVTDRIVAAIERGALPWRCDWTHAGPPRRSNGELYRGINTMLLGMAAAAAIVTTPEQPAARQAAFAF